ncbi:sulfite exporter TauE/SafE family protein [bacterium]|nr:sulfite exporter TauE/SafE family protein [bacterium]
MLEVLDISLFIAVLIALLSSSLTAYIGFGGALIMVPLYTLLFGPIEAIAITTICSVLGLSYVVFKLLSEIDWSEILPLSVGIVIANFVGIQFLTSTDASIITLGIGICVSIAGLTLMFDFKYRGDRGIGKNFVVGVTCGGIMGAFGVPSGPILVVYFLAAPISQVKQRAHILFPIWLMCLVTAATLIAKGQVETETFLRTSFIVPGSLFGAWLGLYIFKKAPVTWFKSIANWILIAIGISLLINQLDLRNFEFAKPFF